MNLGVLEGRLRNVKNAEKYLFKAKTIKPYDYRIYLNLGNVYLQDQNYKASIEYYREALKLEKNNLKILKPYMNALSKLEKWNDLEEVCKTILKIDKTNTKALALLTRCMKETNKLTELEDLFNKISQKVEVFEKKKIINNYEPSNTPTNFGEKYTKDQIKKTIHKLKKKLKTKLKEIKKSKMFHLQYNHTENEPNDNNHLNVIPKSSRNMPRDFNDPNSQIINSIEKLPEEYIAMLEVDKNNKEALYHLGLFYSKRGEYLHADEFFLRLLSIDPKYNPQIVNEKLGDSQFKKYKNYQSALKYYDDAHRCNATATLFVKIGRCWEKLKNDEKALNEYKKSLQVNPNFLWGIFHLGCILTKIGEAEGIDYLKKANEIDKDNTDIIIKYAEELVKLNDKAKGEMALELLMKAKGSHHGNVEILICLAKVYDKLDNIKLAISILEEANAYSEFYSNPNRLFILAMLYEKDKNYHKSIEIYKLILAKNKEHLQSMIHLAFILQNAREYKRAFKYFQFALKIDPNLPAAHFGLGRIYQAMRNFTDAESHYLQCALSDRDNYRPYFHMGVIFLETQNYHKAKEMFIKSLELKPDHTLSRVGLGNVYYEEEDFISAEKEHSIAYNSTDNKLQTVLSYANTLSALHKYDKAIGLYLQALKLDDDISDVHYSLGNAYYMTDHYDEAIIHYVKSLKLEKGKKPEAYTNLANALCIKNRHKEAIKCYKEGIKCEPNNMESYYNLGNCYFMVKNFKKACASYEECLKGMYDNTEVKFALCRSYFELSTNESLLRCEELLTQLMNNEPNNTNFLMYYALLKEKTNNSELAITAYKVILYY